MTAVAAPLLSLPPGPELAPLAQTWAWARKPLDLLEESRRRFGATFTLRFVGGRSYVMVTRPADVRAVFLAPPDVLVSGNQGMKPFLGEGSMFVVDGDQHRRHRRLVGPSLRGDRLTEYGKTIDVLVEQMVASWPVGEVFSIVTSLRDLTLDIIFRVMFGVTEPARAAILKRCVHRMMDGVGAKLAFVPFLRVDFGPLSPWGRFLRTRAAFNAVIQEEVEKLRSTSGGRSDVLARLVDEGRGDREPFDDAEIHSELMTLLGAGHETTTAGLAWACQWMLGSPEVSARVVEEARSATAKRADDLPYLSACISETLRMMPPIPIAPRLAAKAFELDGRTFAPGTYVSPCPYLTQRDPEIFAEPLAFRPQRFLDKRPGPFEFFPYGGGGRLCIGAAFANFEMAAILRGVFARVDLELAGSGDQAPARHGITLSPSEGTRVRVTRRRS